MKLYPQEIKDGITDGLAKASMDILIKPNLFAKASVDTYLYPIKSVLVSTGWNKNDDVFDKYEIWKARKTPVNQKIDFEHDELTIIGHITNSFAFNDNGLISDEIPIDDLPEKYHLFTEGFLYTYWQNQERQLLVNTIISEIPEDKWFVSMECIFDDFDYAVKKDDKNWTLKRSEATAFLSKHLRTYGGSGTYEGYTLGRILRNFSFSGKGIVSKPANPASVIVDDTFAGQEVNFIEFSSSSVCNIMKENNMGENDELKKAEAKIKELEAALASKDVEKHIAKASELESALKGLETKLATASCEKDTLTENLSATQKALESLSQELSAAKKEIEDNKKEKEEMAKKAKSSQRTIKLVEAGLTEAEAQEKADKWLDVAEEIFDEFVVAVKNGKENKTAACSVEETVASTEVETEAVPNLEVETNEVMTSIAKFIETERNKNKKSKESK